MEPVRSGAGGLEHLAGEDGEGLVRAAERLGAMVGDVQHPPPVTRTGHVIVNIASRLTALEQWRRNGGYTDAQLRAEVDRVAQEHDLPFDEVYEETKALLLLPPAEIERQYRELVLGKGREHG